MVAVVPFDSFGDYVVLPGSTKGKHSVELQYTKVVRPNAKAPSLSVLAVLPDGTREVQLPIDATKKTTKFDFIVN